MEARATEQTSGAAAQTPRDEREARQHGKHAKQSPQQEAQHRRPHSDEAQPNRTREESTARARSTQARRPRAPQRPQLGSAGVSGAQRGRVARSTRAPRGVRCQAFDAPFSWPSPVFSTSSRRARRVEQLRDLTLVGRCPSAPAISRLLAPGCSAITTARAPSDTSGACSDPSSGSRLCVRARDLAVAARVRAPAGSVPCSRRELRDRAARHAHQRAEQAREPARRHPRAARVCSTAKHGSDDPFGGDLGRLAGRARREAPRSTIFGQLLEHFGATLEHLRSGAERLDHAEPCQRRLFVKQHEQPGRARADARRATPALARICLLDEPAGLTDRLFEAPPGSSLRDR